MSVKRNYRRVNVKSVDGNKLRELAVLHGGVGTSVGLDTAKAEIVVVVRWPDGSYERPWSVRNPLDIQLLITLLLILQETCDSLTIGLESTGTYSESVRCAMTAASLEVHRVNGKSVSDYKEIFDGVPSQHDGKDAAIIAELTHFGKGTPWPFVALSETEQHLRHQVARLTTFQKMATQWLGRLEGLLACHWPEVGSFLDLKSATLLKICQHYGNPASLAADESAREQLRSWGKHFLTFEKIDLVIASAQSTVGIPVGKSQQMWLQEVATEIMAAMKEVKACEKRLQKVAESHDGMKRYVKAVGAVTLCTIWATVGDPRKYSSSGAFLKALGINLKELSSGKRKGELAITKRGPSRARKILFFWGLRAIQKPELKPWFTEFQRVGHSRKGASEHRKMKGLVALMRKLCRSLWFVYQHDLPFEYSKVFPGKPLEKRKPRRRRRRKKVTGRLSIGAAGNEANEPGAGLGATKREVGSK